MKAFKPQKAVPEKKNPFCITLLYLVNSSAVYFTLYKANHSVNSQIQRIQNVLCVRIYTKIAGLKISFKIQQYADIYLLLHYFTCFGRPSRPSSGVNKTVVAACGTDHTVCGASFFKRDQIRTPLFSHA